MHGFSVTDSSGNVVRIVDLVYGMKLPDYIAGPRKGHDEYFSTSFPDILREYIEAVKAMNYLHDRNEIHGDIRRDHLIRDKRSHNLRWIDFDFTYGQSENKFGYDIFGLGNILVYITGGRDITVQQLREESGEIFSKISGEDLNIIFRNRVVNLRKVFPYIPESLNYVLLHFSAGSEVFYDDTRQFLDDLLKAEGDLDKR
jgi:hypothetical protein